MSIKIDKRIKNTKSRLFDALVELNLETEFKMITVKEITKRAEIGRSTFYAHFESKEQLLLSKQNEICRDTLKHVENRNINSLIKELFEHVSQYKQHAKNTLGDESGKIMIKRARSLIESYFMYDTRKEIVDKEMQVMLSRSCSSSIVSMINGWVLQGGKISIARATNKSIKIFELHRNALMNKNVI